MNNKIIPENMTDNISYHPDYIEDPGSVRETRDRKARVIAVTSGAVGVGKTNITTNLGIALATRGSRVCIFDADTNSENINTLLGLTPKYTLEHLLNGERSIDEIIMEGPCNIKVVPAASGIAGLGNLNNDQRQKLLDTLEELGHQFDYLLIDTAAGTGETLQASINSAQYAIIVISPEPASLTNAFSLVKDMKTQGFDKPLYVLINMALNYEDSMSIFNRFDVAVKKYLKITTHYLGYITQDETVIASARLQQPVIMHKPDSPASRCFFSVATDLDKLLPRNIEPSIFNAYSEKHTQREEIKLPESQGDSDIREIFTEEGIDILYACNGILLRWSHDINDLELATELQREFRTLKGGARMAKIDYVSDVCRRVILLLGSLIEGRQQVTPEHIGLMQNTVYSMSAMLQNIQDNRTPESADALISELDRVIIGSPPGMQAIASEEIIAEPNAGIQAQHLLSPEPDDDTDTADHMSMLLDSLNNEASTEEAEKIIDGLINAYIDKHQKYPIDIRKSLYRTLEMQDFPYSEIRDVVLTLESLYEKRCQTPIHSIDDAVIKLFEDVNGSEVKMEEFGRQLQLSYKRQFNKNLLDPFSEFVDSIDSDTYKEKDFNDQMKILRDAYKKRFNRPYREDTEKLLEELRKTSDNLATQEINLHEEFLRLSSHFKSTLSSREELNAKLSLASRQEDKPEEE